MEKNNNKGFTLIELLVVIAIIGILAAVVLASLNTARDQANDAAVKSQLGQMRAEAEIYYGANDNSYAGVCDGDPGNLYTEAQDNGATGGASSCNQSAGAWAASVEMQNGEEWCVDSTGASRSLGAGTLGTNTACPAAS